MCFAQATSARSATIAAMFKASALCALGITPLSMSENPLHEKLPLNGEKADASRGIGQHNVECRPTQHVVSSFSPR